MQKLEVTRTNSPYLEKNDFLYIVTLTKTYTQTIFVSNSTTPSGAQNLN